MSKIAVKISDKYKGLVGTNPEFIDELLSEYVELENDKITRNKLENSKIDLDLNISLKSVLGI